jgi:bifunctional non-homologous end joining protein LigD
MASKRTIRQRGEPASPPAWIKPQLAALVKQAPDGSDWLHEIKFDGYRMHARLDAGRESVTGCRTTGSQPVSGTSLRWNAVGDLGT